MAAVRIRLSLRGCTNRPFYHLVVANSKWKRDGKHLEQVGCYDPMPNANKELVVGLNLERIKYWLSVGATPTVSVYKLLGLAGVLPAHPRLVLEASRKREAAQHIKDKPLELDPPSENNSPIESVDAHDTT
ncbi:small ribosomal subunit protein bS16m-like [Halichondria panicea]|uniref:small ribosomal subunit protein bS16m-like n=1 Tax=Halichondria panicea TaxID=6063 RepID=UPI00312B7FEB